MLRKLKPCNLYREVVGTSDYQEVWRYQKVLIENAGQERKKGNSVPDSVILTQHQSLYTLGRGSTLDNLKFDPNEPGWLREAEMNDIISANFSVQQKHSALPSSFQYLA